MIKLIVFDLDGVLLDAREIHYEALNLALESINPEYKISRQEHLSQYDGLPTRRKLALLTEQKGLPENFHARIWENKQKATISVMRKRIHPVTHHLQILYQLQERGFLIALASNSIRKTVNLALILLGIIEFFDLIYSNEDVDNPKPNTEMYLRIMADMGVAPKETVAIEDSHIGRKCAADSGAWVCGVENPDTLNIQDIQEVIDKANNHYSGL